MEFCLQSSLNGSASNLPDGAAGRSFASSFSGQSGVASPVFHHSGGKILLEPILFLLSFSYIIVRFLLQVLFRDCTTFMVAIMYPICPVHLHQETQRWIVFLLGEEFNNLQQTFQVEDLHQIIYLLLCHRWMHLCLNILRLVPEVLSLFSSSVCHLFSAVV